jgi:2-methylcitrate dehydratase PrpD
LPPEDLLHAEMTVKIKDGRTYMKSIEAPLGNPAKAINAEQCRQKFRKCVAYSALDFDAAQIEALLSTLDSLEDIRDVNRMIAPMLL